MYVAFMVAPVAVNVPHDSELDTAHVPRIESGPFMPPLALIAPPAVIALVVVSVDALIAPPVTSNAHVGLVPIPTLLLTCRLPDMSNVERGFDVPIPMLLLPSP